MSGATPTENIDPTKHIHTHDRINYEDYNSDIKPVLRKLAEKLSVSGTYSIDNIKESIMSYEKICHHDDAYLCECRLQYILDFVREHFYSVEEVKTLIAAFHLDSVQGDYNKDLLMFKRQWITNNIEKKK